MAISRLVQIEELTGKKCGLLEHMFPEEISSGFRDSIKIARRKLRIHENRKNYKTLWKIGVDCIQIKRTFRTAYLARSVSAGLAFQRLRVQFPCRLTY